MFNRSVIISLLGWLVAFISKFHHGLTAWTRVSRAEPGAGVGPCEHIILANGAHLLMRDGY